MNPVAAAFAVAGLATVAGAGVVAGFLREISLPVEPLTDPLDDRRAALLRSLADLEEARSTGALEEPAYERLRAETERRVARVVRAIDHRADPGTAAALERPGRAATAVVAEPRRVPAWAVGVLIAGTVLAVIVVSLFRTSEPQTQAASSPQSSDDPLAFFEHRVEDHPGDLAARLDLAHRYLDAGMLEESLAEYAVALRLDPDDAEAHAHVGMILFQSGRPNKALDFVDRALSTDPGYPEALFIRGVILLRGLDRPGEAIDAFERYLAASPFGLERAKARDLIAEAEDALAGR